MGGLVAAVVAAVLAVPLMRLNGLAAGLATFAVLVIVRTVANSWDQVTNGAAGLSGLPVTTDKNQALVWALIAIVAALVFQNTGLGLRLRGSREDYLAARSLGVGVHTERRVAWVVQRVSRRHRRRSLRPVSGLVQRERLLSQPDVHDARDACRRRA